MITNLQFRNFKSWKSVNLDFAPLTGFFGPNSSGKSSLIQFLLMLKQTKDSPDRSIVLDFGGPDSPCDLGSFSAAVHSHKADEEIRWRLAWKTADEIKIEDPSGKRSEVLFRGTDIAILSAVKLQKEKLVSDFLEYEFAKNRFRLERRGSENGFRLQSEPSTNFEFKRTLGRVWDLPGPIKSYAFPDQAKTYFQNSQFLSEFETAYVKQMDSIIHLGPLREHPKRQYVWSGASPIDVGPRGERTIDAILAATAAKEKRNLRPRAKLLPFQEMIAYWLREMGLIEAFHVEEISAGSGLYRAKVKRDSESAETLITDVGFGVSQILPVLVLLYYVPEESTVILEQPEIHLHPSVQAALADLIIAAVRSRKIQVVIESHSEHLLQRLQRRVAEGADSPLLQIEPGDIKLYFCGTRHGSSHAEKLELNLFGAIENWPKDFFGDQFEELAAREEAALKRGAEPA
jgi:predicted ATPase